MQNAPSRTIFGEITDFLATNPTPEERGEMFDFVRVEEMMSLLKAKMKLKKQSE